MPTTGRGDSLPSSWLRGRGRGWSLLYKDVYQESAASNAVWNDWAFEASGPSNQNITGTLFSDSDTFGAGTVTRGAVTVTGTLYADGDTFGAGTVSQVTTITGTLYADGDTFGSGTVTPGAVPITGTLFAPADTFGSGTVTVGAVTITGTIYADPDSFGAGVVDVAGSGLQSITGLLFENLALFGAGILTIGEGSRIFIRPDRVGPISLTPASAGETALHERTPRALVVAETQPGGIVVRPTRH